MNKNIDRPLRIRNREREKEKKGLILFSWIPDAITQGPNVERVQAV